MLGDFARIVARWVLIEITLAAQVERDALVHALWSCWLCGEELRVHERPERICDECLRAHQTLPRAA